MTEILIHTLEAAIVCLAIIKLLQVRSLYLRSRPTREPTIRSASISTTSSTTRSTNDSRTSPKQIGTGQRLPNKSSLNIKTATNKTNTDNPAPKTLPLPEVSFSMPLPTQEDTAPKQAPSKIKELKKINELSKINTQSKREELSNYIDDFFTDGNNNIVSEPSTTESVSTKPVSISLISEKQRSKTSSSINTCNTNEDDEFITIQEENAKIVRQMQIGMNSSRFGS